MSAAAILEAAGLKVGKSITYKGKTAYIKQIIVDPTEHSLKDEDISKEKIKGVRLVLTIDGEDKQIDASDLV